MKNTQNQLQRFKIKKLLLTLTIIFTLCINAQTPITDANFRHAVYTCLSTNPVDGLCSDSVYGAMPDWNVSNVTRMDAIFHGFPSFNADISAWDVSNVRDMEYMFGSTSFNQDISAWDVSNVRDMSGMFYNASSFNQDISAWDVSNVRDMIQMFRGASSFNQDIDAWDVSKVTSMVRMFRGASSFNQDISAWDVSNVTNMNGMFHNASSFNQDISAWDVSNVMYMTEMFRGASSFNQDISGWCVSNISSEPYYFNTGSPLTEANKPVWGTCPALGIDDQYFTNLSIYPNPAENNLFISGNTSPISISIYNMLGIEVLSVMNTDNINVAKLPSGVYLIYISNGTRHTNRKFVKN